jgi:hypothetical protein
MEPGSEGKNYPESLGNTFAVATMAGKDEASKQKSELWAHADAQSRSAEDLTNTDNTGLMTGLTTPVHGRNVGNDIHNEDQVSPQSVADADADLSLAQQMALLQLASTGIHIKGAIPGDTGSPITVTNDMHVATLANSANNIANQAVVIAGKISVSLSGARLFRPKEEKEVLQQIAEMVVKVDAAKNDGKTLRNCGSNSREAARHVIGFANSGVFTEEFFNALINMPEFSKIRSDVCGVIKSVDEAVYKALQAKFHVDLASFEGRQIVAVSVDELGRSMKPSNLVTPGLTDISLKSRSLVKELLRLIGAATVMSLEDLIVRTNEDLATIQKKDTVTWLQHSTYFDELARIINSFTDVAIALSYELVEGVVGPDALSEVAPIGAHFKTMQKLAPRYVQDLEPRLAKFQEMTSIILQLEAEGKPQLEVLAHAKRLLGSYRRFLSDHEEAENTRIAAEKKITTPPSPTSLAGAAALPVTAPLAGPRIVDQEQTRMIEKLKRENAALKKQLPGGGGGGGGGGRGGGGDRPSKESFDEYHRSLARYHVLNPDGTIKIQRCGAFCRRMQFSTNPLHSVADAELYCQKKGCMTADAQGVLRCRNGEHPPWSEWTETMRGDGNPVPGPK